jgi:hypothetical protein
MLRVVTDEIYVIIDIKSTYEFWFLTPNSQTFSDSTLTKRLIQKISDIESKRDQTNLQMRLSPDDLPDRAIFSGINMDPGIRASRGLLLQNDGGKSEDPNASKKGRGNCKPESRHGNGEPDSRSSTSSAVKKMISAFESTSSQVLLFPPT